MPATHSLRIGLQLPEAERAVRWPEIVAMAQLAEELGFDSLWVGDHLLYRVPGIAPKAPWEAWSMLAALAAATGRISLGPLVASTSFHAPAMLAKKALTIDEISGGRLILGLGAGWNEGEYRAFGFPFDHRVSRFVEAFTIIRTLLREGQVDFHGTWYQVEDCLLLPEPISPGGPPLMVGSIGERMLRATLPHVDAWNIWYADFQNDPLQFGVANTRVTRLCEELGRDPTSVSRTAAVLVGVAGATGRASLYETGATSPALTGSTEELAAGLRSFADQGAGHLQVVLDPISIESIHEIAPAITLAKSL
ncbi:LLM class F420-dependent oxidoreductase [soil metagenome]